MEPAVRAQYTQEVMALVAKAVGVAPTALRCLDGFENFVHEAAVEGIPRIVRATWHERRSREEIGAELHFIRALAENGTPVCRALPLENGACIESVPAAAGSFHVRLFEKAPGAVLPREHRLPDGCLETLPLFLSLREQTLRAVILRSMAPEDRSTPWRRYLDEATGRIRRGEAALGLEP